MYKRVLVALDGSELSEAILPYARAFAKALKIPVELLHVIDSETIMPSLIAPYHRFYHGILTAARGYVTAEREYVGEYLKKLAASFLDSPAIDWSVEIGKPAKIIVQKAAAQVGTLVGMATRGRPAIRRWRLGSVTDEVLQTVSSPVFIVRAIAEKKSNETAILKSVLIPLDGSALAEGAIPQMVELAREMDLGMVLLRVVEVFKQIRTEAKEYLEEKVSQLKREGVTEVTSVLLEGDAAAKIVDLARKNPESLIAMCTHGRTGVAQRVLGSVTRAVIRHSVGPILVIPAELCNR